MDGLRIDDQRLTGQYDIRYEACRPIGAIPHLGQSPADVRVLCSICHLIIYAFLPIYSSIFQQPNNRLTGTLNLPRQKALNSRLIDSNLPRKLSRRHAFLHEMTLEQLTGLQHAGFRR